MLLQLYPSSSHWILDMEMSALDSLFVETPTVRLLIGAGAIVTRMYSSTDYLGKHIPLLVPTSNMLE